MIKGESILGWYGPGRLHDVKPKLDPNKWHPLYHLVGDIHWHMKL